MFGQEGWLQAQQQWLCILDQVAAVAVVSRLSRQAAVDINDAVYETRIAAFPLVCNSDSRPEICHSRHRHACVNFYGLG